ncbi:hypothetical protein BKA62DRAFT_774389 [Auriculariales sp. MPI-PUGE-AT-0066]|nr:hypothetical protein BKA62DRAFT_774389 [Auriculariales sp. MPI-PUGE-AT-0066]
MHFGQPRATLTCALELATRPFTQLASYAQKLVLPSLAFQRDDALSDPQPTLIRAVTAHEEAVICALVADYKEDAVLALRRIVQAQADVDTANATVRQLEQHLSTAREAATSARNQLDTSIKWRDLVHESIRTTRAPLHPVRRIPCEVLLLIFELAFETALKDVDLCLDVRSGRRQTFDLAHVCRTWRCVVQRSGQFWTHLIVDIEGDGQAHRSAADYLHLQMQLARPSPAMKSHLHIAVHDVQAFSFESVHLFEQVNLAMKDASFVTFFGKSFCGESLPAFQAALLHVHSTRIEELTIDTSTALRELQDLQPESDEPTFFEPPSITLPACFGIGTTLKTIIVRGGMPETPKHCEGLSNVTTVLIDAPDDFIFPEQLHDLISATPSLETLALQGLDLVTPDQATATPTVLTHSNLRNFALFISEVEPDAGGVLLQFPALACLTLGFVKCDAVYADSFDLRKVTPVDLAPELKLSVLLSLCAYTSDSLTHITLLNVDMNGALAHTLIDTCPLLQKLVVHGEVMCTLFWATLNKPAAIATMSSLQVLIFETEYLCDAPGHTWDPAHLLGYARTMKRRTEDAKSPLQISITFPSHVATPAWLDELSLVQGSSSSSV